MSEIPPNIERQDIILAMIERYGLSFLLQEPYKTMYTNFLKKPQQYKDSVREIAKGY